MLKLPKKTGIQLSLRLKRQTHPWDMAAEKAKAKTRHEHKTPHALEEAANPLSQIAINTQEANLQENLEHDMHLIDDPDGLDEGFFPCPFCTCWFTHKKNLDFHVKKWCDRIF